MPGVHSSKQGLQPSGVDGIFNVYIIVYKGCYVSVIVVPRVTYVSDSISQYYHAVLWHRYQNHWTAVGQWHFDFL